MADNYLEKRMEDYRRGASSAVRRRTTPTGRKPGEIVFSLSPKRVVLACDLGSGAATAESVIRSFSSIGCKVAFCCSDTARGNRMAQSSGSRCLPVDVSDCDAFGAALDSVVHDWGDIDIVIALAPDEIPEYPSDLSLSAVPPFPVASPVDALPSLLPLWVAARRMYRTRAGSPVANTYGKIIVVAPPSGYLAALASRLSEAMEPLAVSVATISPSSADAVARECIFRAL